MHRDIGRQYFLTGFIDEAIGEVGRAIEMSPTLKKAYFDRALYHLAKGEIAESQRLYSVAIGKFGFDKSAEEQLRGADVIGVPREAIRSVMDSIAKSQLGK